MATINSSQCKQLRAMAHHLDPLILVGKEGVSDMLVRATSEALENHELVKVKFNEFKDEKKALIGRIAHRTASDLVGMIGNVAILYRRQPDEEKRKINLDR